MNGTVAVRYPWRFFHFDIVFAGGSVWLAVFQSGIAAMPAVYRGAVLLVEIIVLNEMLACFAAWSVHDDHLKTIIEFITL